MTAYPKSHLKAAMALAAFLASALALAWALRCARLDGPGGLLKVDESGAAWFKPASEDDWLSINLRAWGRIGPLAWMAADVRGMPVTLLSGADRCRDDQWSALCAWLRWLDRGGNRRQLALGNSSAGPNL